MEIKKTGENLVSVEVSQAQWARLFKIIDWVRIEGGCMDDASLALSEDQLAKALREWGDITASTVRL